MIIKKNKADQLRPPSAPTAPGGGMGDIDDGLGLDLGFDEPQDLWTEEAVRMGEAQERRMDERRRGYRRVEDKNLISKAYEEANAIRENARREGFEQGLQLAESSLIELRDLFHNLMAGQEEALASVANDIAGLAVEVAERIIKTEVSCDETLVMALVRDAIQKAGRNSKSILVKVHPGESRLVKQLLKEDPIQNLNAELVIMDEPSVDAGSCVIETNGGLIDASFSTQLELLRGLFGISPNR